LVNGKVKVAFFKALPATSTLTFLAPELYHFSLSSQAPQKQKKMEFTEKLEVVKSIMILA